MLNLLSIQQLLKDCIYKLCVERPEDPVEYIYKHFERLHKDSGSRKQPPKHSSSSFTSRLPSSRGESKSFLNLDSQGDRRISNESEAMSDSSAMNAQAKAGKRRGAVR